MANTNGTNKSESDSKPKPTSDKHSDNTKKPSNEQANVKKAAKEATQEALATGESPA